MKSTTILLLVVLLVVDIAQSSVLLFASKSEINSVTCPDGSSCPDKTTCCTTDSGKHDCCPVQLLADETVRDVKCGDGSACSDGSTCCQLASGGYGCCPYPEAVCCSDKEHCCPNGYKCNVEANKCEQGLVLIPWSVPSQAKVAARNTIVCPDGSSCSDENTCCEIATGGYGCCIYQHGVCCADKIHCCRNGYTCNVPKQSCDHGFLSEPWSTPKMSKSAIHTSVACPDGSTCPDSSTCCQLSSGGYGCCPHPQAVCCSDKEHCCPSGYTCNILQQKCDRGSLSMPWSAPKQSSTPVAVSDVQCDDMSSCPDGSTCCQLTTGRFGCCPYDGAVCCDDKKHCCPHGYTCNVPQQRCDHGLLSVPWSSPNPSSSPEYVGSVKCDDRSSCPDGSTCCQLSTGGFGCCPYKEAVCCSDKEHCCPSGFTCNLAQQTCERGSLSVPWSLPKLSSSVKVLDVRCDDRSSCPDGSTCCQLSTGGFGCCPYKEAICCSDKEHCCPSGFTCNLAQQTCDQGSLSVPWSLPKLSSPVKVLDVRCDDKSSCPDGSTCCQLSTGGFGCCPYSEAVCCSDLEHCCPSGFTCNLEQQTCDQGSLSVPWSLPKVSAPVKVLDVKCDGQSSCPDGSTCCKLASGSYGCCPYPSAVCCSDMAHCCPSGFTCNVAQQTCDRGLMSMSWSIPLKGPIAVTVRNVPCPGGTATCPDDNTCCQLSSGSYGCCPLPQAVCCNDHLHCCPHGYQCDTTAGRCTSQDVSIPWSVKHPASMAVNSAASSAVVSMSQERKPACQCPSGNTCCHSENSIVGYQCCPFENAVCCSDGVHCCPSGSMCEPSTRMCQSISSSLAISWQPMRRRSAYVGQLRSESTKQNEDCPDKSQCSDGTCCMLQSGRYGCCSFEKAVCCADKLHCCPAGMTCDVEKGICTSNGIELPWQLFSRRQSRAAKVAPEISNKVRP